MESTNTNNAKSEPKTSLVVVKSEPETSHDGKTRTSNRKKNRKENRLRPFNPNHEEVIVLSDSSQEEDTSDMKLPAIPRKSSNQMNWRNPHNQQHHQNFRPYPSHPPSRNQMQSLHRLDPLLTRQLPPDNNIRTGIRFNAHNRGSIYTSETQNDIRSHYRIYIAERVAHRYKVHHKDDANFLCSWLIWLIKQREHPNINEITDFLYFLTFEIFGNNSFV